ncbi:uncharacterized protein [Miscanthus floridulus]|uniref:uncharacterized protein n=1 Tax=Miscanthus floridulus TaxID=154761 RepID=UPI003457CDF7
MATEERRLMDLARTVPAILLLVGTSGKAVASIKCARELFAGKKWGFDDSDDPESPPPNANRGGNGSGGGEPVETTTGGGDHGGSGVPSKTTCGSQAQAILPCGVSVDSGGYWADVLASALAPGEGHLPVAYREITRLVSLHAEAGHVFVNCAARLGLQPDDDEDNGGGGGARTGLQPHRAAPWKRWMDLREAAVCHAHDALLALSSAAAAATAAEDFLRWRSAESPRREGWRSAARQLVKDARRSLGDAKDAARLMRDAVLCEFFVTWMILTRA